MKSPFTRAAGYLAEGLTGLFGLEGARVSAPAIAPFLFQAAPNTLTVEDAQNIVSILMQIVVGVVTVWRMIRPKKTIVEPLPVPVAVKLPAVPIDLPAAEPPPLATPPFITQNTIKTPTSEK